MASSVKPPENAWRQAPDGTWRRPIRGAEVQFRWLERNQGNTTQMVNAVDFDTNIPESELTKRLRNAWLLCHALRPEIATEASPDEDEAELIYRPLTSEENVDAWLADTLHIHMEGDATELKRRLLNGPLSTRGKRSELHLVRCSSGDGDRNTFTLIWHTTHLSMDFLWLPKTLAAIFNAIVQATSGTQASFLDLNYSDVLERLQLDIVSVYEREYKPTPEQKQQALATMGKDMAHIHSKVYPTPRRGCISIPAEASTRITQSARQQGLSLNQAAFAAILLAVKDRDTAVSRTGAVMITPHWNGKWLDASRVVMSSTEVIHYIPFSEHWFTCPRKDQMVHLGRYFRDNLRQRVTSPHHLSIDPQLVTSALEARATLGVAGPDFSFGAVSQGLVALPDEYSQDGRHIKLTDLNIAGKYQDAHTWVSFYVFQEKIYLATSAQAEHRTLQELEGLLADIKSNLEVLYD